MPRLIWLFSLVNLVVGSSAFVIGGIVAPLARDLNVSVPVAGQAMTAYALSTALLAPLVMMATARWPRKRALMFALAVFLVGNVASALATHIGALYVGRVVMGVGAAFTPMAAGLAVAMVPAAQRGRALSLVFLGMSLSYVVGVPMGAWLAEAYRWQLPVWITSAGLLLLLGALAWWVPSDLKAAPAAPTQAGSVLKRGDVQAVLASTFFYFLAIFVMFSYVAPVLQALVPMSPSRQALTLGVFGLAGAVGTLAGGWVSDRYGARRTLATGMSGLAVSMTLLPFTAGSWPLLLVVLILWGLSGFSLMAPQQSRLTAMAPAQAPLLLSLNASMLYLGTAAGAIVGGAAAPRLGLTHLALAGLPFVAAALALLRFGPHSSGATGLASRSGPGASAR